MAYKVEMICYQCGNDFEVKDDKALPIDSEGGYIKKAICTHCQTDNGEIHVSLVIK